MTTGWSLLAGAVCFAASLAAVCLFGRARSTAKHVRAGWIAAAGAAAGCGIWATHFIAMLAYEPGVPVGYDVALTTLSLIAAVAMTSAGLAVACAMNPPRGAGLGGVIVGAGVAAMHYTGMAALHVPGRVTWSAALVAASIAFGIAACRRRADGGGAPARRTRDAVGRRSAHARDRLHHFTAMGAVTIVPDPTRSIDPLAVSESVLAMAIAGVTLGILGASILAAVMDQRIAQKNALLDTALNNMTHGVMMFDADTRVILCNQRYLELYRLPPGTIKPGLALRDVIERRIAAGTFDGDPDSYCATVLGAVARRQASRQIIEQPDGRTIEVVGQPLADGGWVATHQDITEERRRQASFRFLFENNPLPMWVWDHETLRFLAVNKAAEEKYGYDRETFLRLTLRDIKRSSDWSSIESTVNGDESGLREGQTTVHARADGSLFDVAFYGRSMNYEGRAASLITLIDITERKRAEDELRRTRTFLDTIVENMPAVLTVKDARDKRYVLVNRAAERSFGVPGAEIVGKRADEIFSKQTADFVDNMRPRGRRIRNAARRRGAAVRDAAQRRAPVQHQEAAGARRGWRRAIPAQPLRGRDRPQARARPDRAHGAA